MNVNESFQECKTRRSKALSHHTLPTSVEDTYQSCDKKDL